MWPWSFRSIVSISLVRGREEEEEGMKVEEKGKKSPGLDLALLNFWVTPKRE